MDEDYTAPQFELAEPHLGVTTSTHPHATGQPQDPSSWKSPRSRLPCAAWSQQAAFSDSDHWFGEWGTPSTTQQNMLPLQVNQEIDWSNNDSSSAMSLPIAPDLPDGGRQYRSTHTSLLEDWPPIAAPNTSRDDCYQAPGYLTQRLADTTLPERAFPRRRSRYFFHQGKAIAEPMLRRTSSDLTRRSSDSIHDLHHISSDTQTMPHVADNVFSWDIGQRGDSLACSQEGSTTSWDSRTSQSAHSVGLMRGRRPKNARQQSSSSRGNAGNIKALDSSCHPKQKAEKHRIFQCTFCCDSFRSKHEWSRHEKSLHLNVDRWVCSPHGGSVVSPLTGRKHCAYCNMLDPTPEHLASHFHGVCQGREQPHVFTRKDHLLQHLRLVHQLETTPILDGWKVATTPVVSRCGFCDATMKSWDERVEHLARHFRSGLTMAEWTGDHCFEPTVAAQVNNALPPYLLSAQMKTPAPFSATDPTTKEHFSQILKSTSSWTAENAIDTSQANFALSGPSDDCTVNFADVLAGHLGRYAQQQIRLGIVPTDEMLRDESRRIVYGSSDPFNYTIAENSEWLSAMRRRYLSNNFDLDPNGPGI